MITSTYVTYYIKEKSLQLTPTTASKQHCSHMVNQLRTYTKINILAIITVLI